MSPCDCCGNKYDKAFQVIARGTTYTFDCFECAIQILAPACSHCACKVIGHGLESRGRIYCCAHCSRMAGVTGLEDRVS
jgi:hypothetical protein